MPAAQKQRSPLLPIFLIVLVDVLGFTIVIPLLALYAENFGASPLIATTLVSCYAVCSLISTPIIGNLSDRYGRKPLLLISQAGTCAGFLMLGYSSALWMVFAGRILDGITAGNLSIAQAYISDHTTPENRTKAFGVIGVAFGVGFMFGPGIGGLLGEYGMHVPFVVAACLSALSMLATYTLLPEGKPPQADEAASKPAPNPAPNPTEPQALPGGKRPSAFDIATYTEYFRRPGLAALYTQFFIFTFAFSMFTSGFALFAERRMSLHRDVKIATPCLLTVDGKVDPTTAHIGRLTVDGRDLEYGTEWFALPAEMVLITPKPCAAMSATSKIDLQLPWTAREVGLLFTFSGLLGIILQGGLIGRLAKKFGEVKLGIAGFIAAAAAYAILGFAATVWMLLVVAVFSAFGNGVLRPALTTRITKTVGRHEQGVALGISGSLSSLAMAMAPPTGGTLIGHGWLVAWGCVPAMISLIGLAVALSSRE